MQEKPKKVIGRAETIAFPELGIEPVHARIDTGAKTSAISVSHTTIKEGVLEVAFFNDPKRIHRFSAFEKTVVASSTGHAQERFKIRLLVVVGGKRIRAWFTLADRSKQVYPVLIGRNVLRGKFIVDVKEGTALTAEERKRTKALRANLENQES